MVVIKKCLWDFVLCGRGKGDIIFLVTKGQMGVSGLRAYKIRILAAVMALVMIGSAFPVMADDMQSDVQTAQEASPAEEETEEEQSAPDCEPAQPESCEDENAVREEDSEPVDNAEALSDEEEPASEASEGSAPAGDTEPGAVPEDEGEEDDRLPDGVTDEEEPLQADPFEPDTVSGLPILNIHLNGVNLEMIKAGSKEEKYDGNIADLYIDGNKTSFEQVRVKGRGNSTWTYPKKPYQIKFDKKTDMFGQRYPTSSPISGGEREDVLAAVYEAAKKKKIPVVLEPGSDDSDIVYNELKAIREVSI